MDSREVVLTISVEEEPTVRELGNFLQLLGALQAALWHNFDEYEWVEMGPLLESIVGEQNADDVLEANELEYPEVELSKQEQDVVESERGYEMSMEEETTQLVAEMAFSGVLKDIRDYWDYYAYDADESSPIKIDRISSESPIIITAIGVGFSVVFTMALLMSHENDAGDKTIFVEGEKLIFRIKNLGRAAKRGENLTGQGSSDR